MKIRILGNSLRLRLTQTEVTLLAQDGAVEQSIRFGPSTKQLLKYSLSRSSMQEISAVFFENEIKVNVPSSIISDWATSSEISLKHNIDIGNEENLTILIEKDFKCRTEREGEDESDLHPHPEDGSC